MVNPGKLKAQLKTDYGELRREGEEQLRFGVRLRNSLHARRPKLPPDVAGAGDGVRRRYFSRSTSPIRLKCRRAALSGAAIIPGHRLVAPEAPAACGIFLRSGVAGKNFPNSGVGSVIYDLSRIDTAHSAAYPKLARLCVFAHRGTSNRHAFFAPPPEVFYRPPTLAGS